ncbi:hypothetical protein MUN82_14550 [Hymenobacter aerilatus]|uniref:Uncharacterized protein n=1 Tax=Hymenobacter aerilatus TaxID=2932251 RepID=A0A8T9SS29_9BACT|nr:hypothetical protein [Hymenobacter aerilatus]UOR04161.1 hypothetical protein MUN82_14550 [Hymenobacter aerilatus]
MENFFTSESIALLALGLIIVGIIKFIYYYKAFNIAILRYIESSEILVLFADNISIAAAVVLLLLPPYMYSILPYVQSEANVNYSFTERLSNYWSVLSTHFIYQSIIATAGIIFTFIRKRITKYERWTYLPLSVFIIFILPLLTIEAGYWAIPVIKPANVVMLGLVSNFIVLILLATHNEIYKVKKRGFFNKMSFEFEDNTVIPNDAYFVGKVKSFIFFYNPINNESITYSTSKLKCVKYKPN